MVSLRVRPFHLGKLIAAMMGIDLRENEWIADPEVIARERFGLDVFMTNTHTPPKHIYHLVFEHDSEAVAFKLKWHQFFE